MKFLFFLTILFFVFNLNSCVSQVEPVKKAESNSEAPVEDIFKSKSNSDDSGKESGEEIIEDSNAELFEEKTKVMSVISYSVIQETKDKEQINKEVPARGQKVKLLIQNNHNVDMWYLMPASGEKHLPENGKFESDPLIDLPFAANKITQNEKYLVEIIFSGVHGQSFRAFFVKANSSLLFRNYDLGFYKQGEFVPFWSVQSLFVNNNISLQKWLPFSVESSPGVVIQNSADVPLVSESLTDKLEFNNEKMIFIQAKVVQQFKIPVGNIR